MVTISLPCPHCLRFRFPKIPIKIYVSLLQLDMISRISQYCTFFVYASGIDTLRSPVTISILIGLVYKQSQQLDKQTLIYKLLKEH